MDAQHSTIGNPESERILPRPELTPSEEINAERILIYMLGMPGYQVQGTEVGQQLRQDMNMEVDEWRAASSELIRRNMLASSKSDHKLPRNDTISLNLAGVIDAASGNAANVPSYLTQSVVEAARNARKNKTEKELSPPLGSIVIKDTRK